MNRFLTCAGVCRGLLLYCQSSNTLAFIRTNDLRKSIDNLACSKRFLLQIYCDTCL